MPRAVSTTRFSRRVFLTVTAACVFLLACELACQVALIGDVADAALRLIVCSVVAGLLIAAVIVFAACSTGGFALGVTRKAPSLDDAPLIGRHGTGHHILRRTLFAGSALAVGSLFLLLLHSLEEANGRLQTDVAHRRRAEALLAKREQLHRNAIASANGVAYQLEFESNTYSHMDAAIERLLGYDLSKISRDIWRNIIRQTVLRGDAATVSLEDAARAFRAGAFPVWQADYQCTAKDGSTVWLADSSVLIRDEDGTITGSLGILQDVTERKSVERELRQSEANLSDFFENATIGLHWVGPDGTILGANRAELELLGYAEGEYVGRPIAEFHDDGDVIEDILRRLSGGERLRDYEAKMRCKDGTIKTVQIDSSVLWQNGEFVHTRCFTRDITGRKQAEEALQAANDELERRVAERTSELSEANVGLLLEVGEREKAERALRESEQRYELAVRGTADGIWDWDILSGSVYRSPRVWELLGYDAEEISPTFDGFSSLLHPDDRDRAQDAVRRHLEQREPYHMEYRMRTKTGDYRWFETRGEAVWDDDGNPVRMAGSIRDITSRRAAESELRLSAEIAQNMAEGVSLIRVSDETIVFTNPRFDVLFGYEPGELIGRHVSILNAAGDKSPEETAAEIICGVEENGSWSGEIPNVKKDGTAFWTRATVSAFEHPQHGAVWVAVQDDNTRRKKAEDRVAALGRILDDSLNEIYIFDARSLRFLQVNRGAIQNLGYALDELH
ncbi:MAG: PAS domain-containing protein, partial [Planctomycetaceae bacterium]